jgi:lysozyme
MQTKNLAIIKHCEGKSLVAYKCPADVWSIGYGHTRGVVPGDKITEKEAEAFLREDIADAEDAVNTYVTAPISQTMFDALVSFVFNVGAGNFKESTLLKKLNAKDYTGAANEFHRWTYAGGKKLTGLVKRRKYESLLFINAPFELM